MRNYKYIDEYLTELAGDVYAQPEDAGHIQMALEVFNAWVVPLDIKLFLDIGCGATAFMQDIVMKNTQASYGGVALGSDAETAIRDGKFVRNWDMSFLELPDNSFDLVWARHVLEHSPMPLLTLMEWHRVSSKYLCLIMPNPKYFTYAGRNHYSVFDAHHIVWLLRRAGWKIVNHELTGQEFRFLCLKEPRISYEGYVEAPLSGAVHEFERDNFEVRR